MLWWALISCSPTHLATGVVTPLPHCLILCESDCSVRSLFHLVWSSGYPCNRSNSMGVNCLGLSVSEVTQTAEIRLTGGENPVWKASCDPWLR